MGLMENTSKSLYEFGRASNSGTWFLFKTGYKPILYMTEGSKCCTYFSKALSKKPQGTKAVITVKSKDTKAHSHPLIRTEVVAYKNSWRFSSSTGIKSRKIFSAHTSVLESLEMLHRETKKTHSNPSLDTW